MDWWIQRLFELPKEKRTGWIVAQVLDNYGDEKTYIEACGYDSYAKRIAEAGLQCLDGQAPPRKRCNLIRQANCSVIQLLDETGQRSMIAAIAQSIKSYAAGIRCWAAFQDATNQPYHFPATEDMVVRYTAIFAQAGTLATYLKHLRWAHRFLRLHNDWDTSCLKQVVRGRNKVSLAPKERLGLNGQQVHKIMKLAEIADDHEMVALLAIGRAFLFRMPSECFPLERDGSHSEVTGSNNVARVVLARRKTTNPDIGGVAITGAINGCTQWVQTTAAIQRA